MINLRNGPGMARPLLVLAALGCGGTTSPDPAEAQGLPVGIGPHEAQTSPITLADGPSVGVVDLVTRKLVRTIGVGVSPDGVGYGPTP